MSRRLAYIGPEHHCHIKQEAKTPSYHTYRQSRQLTQQRRRDWQGRRPCTVHQSLCDKGSTTTTPNLRASCDCERLPRDCALAPNQLPAPLCLVRSTRTFWLLARSAETADGHVRQLSHRKEGLRCRQPVQGGRRERQTHESRRLVQPLF